MKKITIILIVFCAFSFEKISAQSNIIRISPGGFALSKLKLHYEMGLNEKFSAGVIASYFYGGYKGYRIEPFARFYMSEEALNGFYLQAKPYYSSHTYSVETTIGTTTTTETHGISDLGATLDIGWQTYITDNVCLDFFVGYRYSSFVPVYGTDSGFSLGQLVGDFAYKAIHSNGVSLGLSAGFRF